MAYPYGFSLFCDDIRDEVAGKTSFIGAYRAAMFVHGDFPFVLPKFCIYATYIHQAEQAPDELTLKVYLPGDADGNPSISGSVPLTELAKGTPDFTPDDSEVDKIRRAEARVQLSPFIIQQEGTLKVRFEANGKTTKAGTLLIKKAPASHPAKG